MTTFFSDNYHVKGNKGGNNINTASNDQPDRFSDGLLGRMSYTLSAGTINSQIQVGSTNAFLNHGTCVNSLFFATYSNPNNSNNRFSHASPSYDFGNYLGALNALEENGRSYEINFKVSPVYDDERVDIDDIDHRWAAFVFGTTQSKQTANVSASDGVGIIIRRDGGLRIYDGTNNNSYTDFAAGTFSLIDDWANVKIVYTVPDFDGNSPVSYSLYVNNNLIGSYQTVKGFYNNYVQFEAFSDHPSHWCRTLVQDFSLKSSAHLNYDVDLVDLSRNWETNGLDKQNVVFQTARDGATEADHTGTITLGANTEFNVATGLTLTQSGVISGTKDITKIGDGTLTLSGDNSYSGMTTVSGGTLELTGSAIKTNGVINLINDENHETYELVYNVDTAEKTLDFTNAAYVMGNGDILKTGEGRLKINTEQLTGDLHFTADNFVVASGPVDIKGYMYCNLSVEGPDAVFSPGNSVGDATFGGGFILKEGATLLIEQDASGIDTLTASSFNIDSNSIIDIAADSLQPGAEYPIIVNSSGDFSGDLQNDNYWNGLLTPGSDYYWNLSVRGDTVYASVDANAVPEPSTWALLALGVVVLFLRKRVRN